MKDRCIFWVSIFGAAFWFFVLQPDLVERTLRSTEKFVKELISH